MPIEKAKQLIYLRPLQDLVSIEQVLVRQYLAIHSFRALVISDGGTKPYRVHFRDPSFNNLQAVGPMGEGGQVADIVAAVASIDPVMGGVDR